MRLVDGHPHLDRLAGPFGGQRNQRVGGVGGAGLVPPGPARVAKDAVDVGFPRRVEPGAGIGRHARVDAVAAVGIGPLVGPPLHVEAPRPGPVVLFGAGTHQAGLVTKPLHTRGAGGLEQFGFRCRVRAGRTGGLGRLRRRQRTGAERSIGVR
jgi:hypothetical protein